MNTKANTPRRPLCVLIVSLGLAAGCAELSQLGRLGASALDLPVDVPDLSGLSLMSEEDEAKMARENAQTFEQENELWDDPLLESYVTDIVQRLADVAHPRSFRYRVRIVNNGAVNAFTFGGGLLYVNAGLIARMETEGQLAMVLSHELAHVTERHVPRGLRANAAFGALGQAVGQAASPQLSAEHVAAAFEHGMNAAVSGHGRSLESEADEVGLQYLVAAGYDPHEAPKTFERLLEEYGDQGLVENFFYGSHPRNKARMAATSALIREHYAAVAATRTPVADTQAFRDRTRPVVVAAGIADFEALRLGSAQAMFQKAIRTWDADPVAYVYLARIELAGAGSAPAAVEHLLAAIRAEPGYAPAYRELGLAYERMGDTAKAVDALRRYLSLGADGDGEAVGDALAALEAEAARDRRAR